MSDNRLIDDINQTLREAQAQALEMLNHKLITTNWTVGKLIFDSERIEPYCLKKISQLAESLRAAYGLNIADEQLLLNRKFYTTYPIFKKISLQLSWAHYIALMELEDELARAFYQRQTEKGKWDSHLLKANMANELFEKFKKTEHKNDVFHQDTKPLHATKQETFTIDEHLRNFLNI